MLLTIASLALVQAGPVPHSALPPSSPTIRPFIGTLDGAFGAGQPRLFDRRTGRPFSARPMGPLEDWTFIEPVGLDFCGRTEADGAANRRPRWRPDIGRGVRIELPDRRGTIVGVRGLHLGTLRYGLVHVGADGIPRLALARDGLAGGLSPFAEKIAVGPGGRSLLVATRAAAGGDLIEVDLQTRSAVVRTANLPPQTFGVDGLWLFNEWGYGVTPQGPLRFQRDSGSQAELVGVAVASPGNWRGDAAANFIANRAVAIRGFAPDQWTPFVFGPTGPAQAAASNPQKISPAGFEPEVSYGPFLALCNDGLTAAWRVEAGPPSAPIHDVVLGRASLTPLEVVASGDVQIIDTMNEVTRIIPSPVGDVLFAVGEPNDPTEGGVEAADILGAGLDPSGSLTLRNVSRTSADTSLPLFDQDLPTWTPARLVFLTEDIALVHEDDTRALFTLNVRTRLRSLVMDAVREVAWIEVAGPDGGWFAAIERDNSARSWQIVGAPNALQSASVVDPGASNADHLFPVGWRGATTDTSSVAYVTRVAGLEFVSVVLVNNLQRIRWSSTPTSFVPPLAFVDTDTLVFSHQSAPGGVDQRMWSFRAGLPDLVLDASPRPAILLR